jgi:MFS family permease
MQLQKPISPSRNQDELKPAYAVLFAVNFLVALGFSLLDPFLAIYTTGIGATAISTALIFSGYNLSKALLSPLAGLWTQKTPKRWVITTGLILYSLVAFGLLFQPDLTPLLLLRVIQGAALAFIRPVSLAFVGDLVPVRREGALMGKFDISFYSAIAIGPALGGAVKDAAGFPGIFAIFFAVSILSLLLVILFWRRLDTCEEAPRKGLGSLRQVFRSRGLLALNAFIFARIFGISLCAIFLPVFLSVHLRLTGGEIGLVMASGSAITVLFLIPMGQVADRIDRKLLITFGSTACALLIFLLPFCGSFLQVLALSAVIGFFSVLTIPPTFALLIDLGRRYGTGLTMGIFNGAINLGFIVAPLAGGLVADLYGLQMLFFVAGAVGMAGTVCFLVIGKSSGKGDVAD